MRFLRPHTLYRNLPPCPCRHTSILIPLTTKDCDREFQEWKPEHQEAFQVIKDLVTSTKCLTLIDYEDLTKKIFVTTDVSEHRTGAVLSFGETWEMVKCLTCVKLNLCSSPKVYSTSNLIHNTNLLSSTILFVQEGFPGKYNQFPEDSEACLTIHTMTMHILINFKCDHGIYTIQEGSLRLLKQ